MLLSEIKNGQKFIYDWGWDGKSHQAVYFQKTGYGYRRLDGAHQEFCDPDLTIVSPVDGCYIVNTVKNPSRREWFELWTGNFDAGNVEKVARVKSMGLLNVVLGELKKIYDYIEIR